jgi:Domain of unknown function (DUF4340)
MSGRRLLVLTFVVLALFVFILLFERKQPTTAERMEKGNRVWSLDEAKIDEIRVVRDTSAAPDGTRELAFKKTGDTWKLEKPESYPADSGTLSSLALDLASPERTGIAPAETTPAAYGLDQPRIKVTVVAAGGEKSEKRELWLGRKIPGTDDVAAEIPGAHALFYVHSSLVTSLSKTLSDYKSKDVFNGYAADANRLAILRGRGRLDFEKKDDAWWLTQPLADLADATSVDRMVGDLFGMRVSEFVSTDKARDLASFGLAPALYTVTLSVKGKPPQTVEFGATRSDGKSVYARRAGQVFAVDNSIVDDLSREAEAFRETHVVRFERGDATGITAEFGQGKYDFHKAGSGWQAAGKAVNSSAADDLLSAILDIQSKEFLDRRATAAAGKRPVIGTITAELPKEKKWTLTFHGDGSGTAVVVVSGRPDAMRVDASAVSRLETALKKALPTSPAKVPPKQTHPAHTPVAPPAKAPKAPAKK